VQHQVNLKGKGAAEHQDTIRNMKAASSHVLSAFYCSRVYPNGYMAVGYFLFLQEQIKDIIIVTFIYSDLLCWIVWAIGRGHRDVDAAFGSFSISQLSISHTVVASGREASEKKRAEARRGQGQC
jgi:hypothetical protein